VSIDSTEPTRWVIDLASAREAHKQIQPKLTSWLNRILQDEAYREWKTKQINQTLLVGILPDSEIEHLPDFRFSPEIERQYPLVQGYFEVMSTWISTHQTQFYFRRRPGNLVSREAHLSTCCELFFGRVYQFKERWIKHIKQLARRTHPKGLPVESWEREFRSRFGSILDARHSVHHETSYSDIQTKAAGLGELLAFGNPELDFLVMPRGAYRKIISRWVKEVQVASEGLELYLGLTAKLMLQRCDFL
jgi:hypothetical protein